MKMTVGEARIHDEDPAVQGALVSLAEGDFYKISGVEGMRPFFMSLASDANHWMFISSNGGLTAGRKNSELALFPYYTDDKITESAEHTGCKTLLRVSEGSEARLWEPFSERYQHLYRIQRNLYKSVWGNTLIFEEENHDLKLIFRYQWATSNAYGFVRSASLRDTSGKAREIALLDGLQNLLPWGVSPAMQHSRSNLVDAYKKSELQPDTGLGIYALSAYIVDRAEPSESLKANTVWSCGLPEARYLLSSLQLDRFRKGRPLEEQKALKGERGAYFVSANLALAAGETGEWWIVANVNQGASDVARIKVALQEDPIALKKAVMEDVRAGTVRLLQLTAAADGLQQTGDALAASRHYANVMYNSMRGGIMDANYQLEKADFVPCLEAANRVVAQRQRDLLDALPETFTLFDLRDMANSSEDPDFFRLSMEYLPLKFSRRHGDPSRPWNKFSINTQRESDGSKILDYEGNWRDIFQNWEALAHSYPEFIYGMIHKFLNASTADGYNPYRITKGGIDWEVVDPEDPWAFIGYWGDHQLIYLLKYLEFSEAYFPGRLLENWDKPCFVYANVPYRIRPYEDILKNAKDTIVFDQPLDRELRNRMRELGADGALLADSKGAPFRANFPEKILVSLLTKISNFIPGGGIWMNTQRPEWNDANNALVGNGVSMVTLYYLKRYLSFLRGFLDRHAVGPVNISEAVGRFLRECEDVLESHREVLDGAVTDTVRRTVTDALGRAGGRYRKAVYENGLSQKKVSVAADALSRFISLADAWMEHTIQANRRKDGLYHAYNLMRLEGDSGISLRHLPPMLEGQVAVLSSGSLDAEASAHLLDALRKSPLYREDQDSYMLYPDRELPGFEEKNCIPAESVDASRLLTRLVAEVDRSIVEKDVAGRYHFNGSFHNASDLREALLALPDTYQDLVSQEMELLLEIFEAVFDHSSFTGRSGTFFAYEGLGSIYWHMVSKLLLAAQESCEQAHIQGVPDALLNRLCKHYHSIKEGIGVHKDPEVYGAIPIDPYSHTPAHKGAQQPGMTGQVKEDILSRERELGIVVRDGRLRFDLFLLPDAEFLKETTVFRYFDISGKRKELELPAGSLGFTLCQVPVVYTRSAKAGLEIHRSDGSVNSVQELELDVTATQDLLRRNGNIRLLKVHLDS